MISVSLCVIATIARHAPRLSLNALNLSFNAPYETALSRERIPLILSATAVQEPFSARVGRL